MILKFYVEKLINTKDILTPEEYHKFHLTDATGIELRIVNPNTNGITTGP